MEKSSFGISSFGLRVIAVILMTIDHIGAVLFPHVLILRIIGRLSFPIFVFLMVEGYFHTRDVKKYLTRLLVFAVISEPFFDVVFHHSLLYARGQNIFMTLFLGLLMVHICEKTTNKGFNVFTVLIIGLIAEIGYCDYGALGVIMFFVFYGLREHILAQFVCLAFVNTFFMGIIQGFAALAVFPTALYNGKPGSKKFKYLFYMYYPLHLAILGGIRYVIRK